MSVIAPAVLEITKPPRYVATPWYTPVTTKPGDPLQIVSYVARYVKGTKDTYKIVEKTVTAQPEGRGPKLDTPSVLNTETGGILFSFNAALQHLQVLEKNLIGNDHRKIQSRKNVLEPAVNYRNYLKAGSTASGNLIVGAQYGTMAATAG